MPLIHFLDKTFLCTINNVNRQGGNKETALYEITEDPLPLSDGAPVFLICLKFWQNNFDYNILSLDTEQNVYIVLLKKKVLGHFCPFCWTICPTNVLNLE